ncbi:polysaccharide biosynthesis tyrosine autokinase [Synechococcus sp. PCC 7336]|uniref:GumC family protein n=1 Tax=Synechococcus sp. PCC 7336 TaxID=195250 RepID=UPI00034A4EAA|nr:polysaccharide biosynthesis tyrosine autokinase [Synechococcus sp. PCC 7336]
MLDEDTLDVAATSSESPFGLGDALRALRKRWPWAAVVSAGIMTCCMAYTFTRDTQYRSQFLLLVSNSPGVVGSNEGAPSKEALGFEARTLARAPLLSNIYERLPEVYRAAISPPHLLWNLSVRPLGEEGLMVISYTDSDPARVKGVLETASEFYLEFGEERLRSSQSNAVAFVESSIETAQQALDESADRLRAFREEHGLVDPNGFAGTIAGLKFSLERNVEELEQGIALTRRRLTELRAQLIEVGQDPETALSSTLLSQDGTYQALASQLQGIETQLALQQSRFRAESPVIQTLKQDRDRLVELLRARAGEVLGTVPSAEALLAIVVPPATLSFGTPTTDGTESSASAPAIQQLSLQQTLTSQLQATQLELALQLQRLEGLRVDAASVAERFESLPVLQQEYAELERKVGVNSQQLNTLLVRLQELRIVGAQGAAPWSLFEPPYLPREPFSPNIPRNLLYGLLGSLTLGAGVPVVLELLDGRVKTDRQALELTGVPLLGALPAAEELDTLLLPNPENPDGLEDGDELEELEDSIDVEAVPSPYGYAGRSLFQEALGQLAINVEALPCRNGRSKVLAITSAHPGEGKSTVACNLGKVLAEVGKRVLMVDADFMHSTVHQNFEIGNRVGLSTVFRHPELDWRDMVSSFQQGHLDVLPAGPRVRNPLVWFLSQRMSTLLASWQEVYDYILIDTPPIVGFADAQSVASIVDGVVLVVSLEMASKASVLRATEILQAEHGKLAGLVVNRE